MSDGRERRPALVSRLIADERVRYLAVGGFNTVLGYALFALFQWLFGFFIGYLGSLLLAHFMTSGLAFVLYRRFVFRVSGAPFSDFLRFQSVYIVPLMANAVALPILVDGVGWNVFLAQAVIVVASTILTFFGHKYFSFRRRAESPDGLDELLESDRSEAPVLRTLFALTLVAWGAVLFVPESLIWDDWVTSNSDTLQMYSDLGLPWMGYVAVALWALGPWSFKLVTLASTFLVGSGVYLVSGRGLGLGNGERWLLAAFVIVLPLNTARASSAVLSTYALSLAVFMLAWYLLVVWRGSAPRASRVIIAAVLFFASFTTASLLPFIALPVAHFAVLMIRRDVGFWRAVLDFAGRYWYLLATPVMFWVFRTLALTPSGVYAEYNGFASFDLPWSRVATGAVIVAFVLVIALAALGAWTRTRGRGSRPLLALLGAVTTTVGAILLLAAGATGVPHRLVGLAIVLSGVIFVVVALVMRIDDLPRHRQIVPLVAVGLSVIAFGSLPYMLVGKLPSFFLFETRHQLLLPFGVAIILVAVYRALSPALRPRIREVAGVTVVAAFALASLAVSLGFVVDWHKQQQVIAALEDEPLIAAATTIVFDDQAKQFNYASRTYPFYEFTGWLGAAFGDDTRLGLDSTAVGGYLDGSLDKVAADAGRYGFGDFTPSTDAVVVTIRAVDGSTWWDMLLGKPSVELTTSEPVELSGLR